MQIGRQAADGRAVRSALHTRLERAANACGGILRRPTADVFTLVVCGGAMPSLCSVVPQEGPPPWSVGYQPSSRGLSQPRRERFRCEILNSCSSL
eukprot:3371145-Prymnesium_polylepis.2